MKKIITCLGVSALVTLASQAATIDVTTIGSSGTANGAIFFGIDPQSTGTGIIDPFLREQNNGTEYGINTSIASPPYDDKPGPWTHDLAVSALAPINYGGVDYYSFFLDANQIQNGTISLTTLKIFTSVSALTTAGALATLIAGSPVYDLGANVVNITGNNGSGSGDMLLYIPRSLIGDTGYLYLYAGFGVGEGNFVSNDGFEEWNAVTGARITHSIPDGGATAVLLGAALSGLALLKRRSK